MAHRGAAACLAGVVIALIPSVLAGQSAPLPLVPVATNDSPDLPFTFDGPPPPVAPDVITRDGSGRATIRAIALTSPIQVDGRLDESIYESVPPISDFIQNDPEEGARASERTDVWLLFDRDHLYIVARCHETHPERIVANEMRRDSINVVQNDNFAFMFDTFYDRRNAVIFEVNTIGGRIDAQVTNERQVNMDWNPVWNLEVGRFDGGWTLEAAIPFKSLRYRPGRAQIWGFNARRRTMWRNETSYITRIPAALTARGHFASSLAATVVGLDAPAGSRNLEIKPYAISDVTSDLHATPRVRNDLGADVGLDLKYGVTQNLTADFTYNTDFAQVEADEQQVNLTRFSLFFPEKREFFLENQGMFQFGGTLGIGAGSSGSSGASGQPANPSDTPLLFYSRRIGLNGGREVPIDAGGRLTGRVGRFSVGVLNIQSDDEPVSQSRPTNFSVVRLKRDVLRKSSVGLIFTGRSVAQNGIGSNQAYGVDGTFAFFDNLAINTYWAQTRTDALTGDDTSYRAQLDYGGDLYGVQLERLAVGDDFNPEVGFLRRDDMRRNYAQFRFSPRPRSRVVRKFSGMGSIAYVDNGAGRLETRDQQAEFAIELHNSDRFFVGYGNMYEFLPRPFDISPTVTLPTGGYNFSSVRAGYTFGQQRDGSGTVMVERGTFYNGDKTTVIVNRGRLGLGPQLSIEPRLSLDWVDLVEGSFSSRLIGSRVTYTMTPLMFASALLQFNSGGEIVSANIRFRWEYASGSELFVVVNEERDTFARGFPDLANRSVIVKINRLLRF